MNQISKSNRWRYFAALLVFGLLFSLSLTAAAQDNTYKVVFLLADSPTDQGWNAAHYRGIEMLKDLGTVESEDGLSFNVGLEDGTTLAVQVIEKVGYNDADIERVARQAINQGANYIFGTWFDSMGAMSRLAEEFPDILFEHGSGYPLVQSNGTNFSTYFIRMEQGDYVAGYVAGLLGYSNIGVVGTYPIPEPVRGINGFALGLQRGLSEVGSDPTEAVAQIVWLNTWLDREKETQAAQALLDQGFGVIRQMADTPYASQTTCDAGDDKIAIGYGSDVSTVAPCALVTNAWNWGNYYVAQVKAALDGTWESHDWWGGFADDAITMDGWNDTLVPADVQDKAQAVVDSIKSGDFDPFCGPISGVGAAADGSTVDIEVPEGKCLSDMDLLTMQWYVNGVKGELPPAPDGGFSLELTDAM